MTEEFNDIQNHLKSDKLNYIDVLDVNSNNYIDKLLYFAQIVEKHGDLNSFFSSLLKEGITKLQIFKRKKQGSGNRLMGAIIPLKLGVKEPQNEAQVHGLGMPSSMPSYSQKETNMSPQTLSMEFAYKARILDLEERIVSYKQDLEEMRGDKNKIQRNLEAAYDELRIAKVKIATSDKELELALLKKDAEAKNFMDSDGFKHVVTEVKGLGISLNGGMQNTASQLSAPSNDYGLYKKSILETLDYPIVTEEIAKLMLITVKGALDHKDAFMSEFTKLIEQFNISVE